MSEENAHQDAHLDKHLSQQRHRQEFDTKSSKSRSEARSRSQQQQQESDSSRPHQHGGSKPTKKSRQGGQGGGQQSHDSGPKSSLFIQHITTSYPTLSYTYKQIYSRLPIPIPNPTNLPLINRLPSPAALPVLSSIDAALDGILTRIDSAFPVIKSHPDDLVQQVANITDPWVAPANEWLEDHLPSTSRQRERQSQQRQEQRRDRGKKWSEENAPGKKSYADMAAPDDEQQQQGGGEHKEEEHEDEDKEMELRRTVDILLAVVDAQMQKANQARGYVAEVLLPGYVPLVGGWLGGKVAAAKKQRKEKPGKKSGEGRRFTAGVRQGEQEGEKGIGAMGEGEEGESVVRVGGETRRADEGVTVIGGHREM